MERKGSGIGKVIDGYRNAENFKEDKLPTFYSDKSQFTVIFPNLNYGYKEEDGGLIDDKSTLIDNLEISNHQEAILSLIIDNPAISKKELSELLKKSESSIQKNIRILKQLGILKRIGSTRGYWQINIKND